MRLWTHHPSTFDLSDQTLIVDWKKGMFWRKEDSVFRYRKTLPMLHKLVGTDQLIWCCTRRATYKRESEFIDLTEWEINLPIKDVILTSSPIWEDLIWSRSDDWGSLILKGLAESEAVSDSVVALVRFPIRPDCLTWHGPLPVQHLSDGTINPSYTSFVETGER